MCAPAPPHESPPSRKVSICFTSQAEAVVTSLVKHGGTWTEDRTRPPMLVPLTLLGCRVTVEELVIGDAYSGTEYEVAEPRPTHGGPLLRTLVLQEADLAKEAMKAGGELPFEAMKVPQLKAAPPADEFAAAITAANAVCFFSELTKVPHILEPSTTPSDRTGDMPTREALESKVNVSTAPAPTNSASRNQGTDMIDDVALAAQRERAREVCERPVSPPPPSPIITEECGAGVVGPAC